VGDILALSASWDLQLHTPKEEPTRTKQDNRAERFNDRPRMGNKGPTNHVRRAGGIQAVRPQTAGGAGKGQDNNGGKAMGDTAGV
jgi:hypothetical protein